MDTNLDDTPIPKLTDEEKKALETVVVKEDPKGIMEQRVVPATPSQEAEPTVQEAKNSVTISDVVKMGMRLTEIAKEEAPLLNLRLFRKPVVCFWSCICRKKGDKCHHKKVHEHSSACERNTCFYREGMTLKCTPYRPVDDKKKKERERKQKRHDKVCYTCKAIVLKSNTYGRYDCDNGKVWKEVGAIRVAPDFCCKHWEGGRLYKQLIENRRKVKEQKRAKRILQKEEEHEKRIKTAEANRTKRNGNESVRRLNKTLAKVSRRQAKKRRRG